MQDRVRGADETAINGTRPVIQQYSLHGRLASRRGKWRRPAGGRRCTSPLTISAGGTILKSLPIFFAVALLFLTPAPAIPYVTAPWSPGMLWESRNAATPEPLAYLLYNNTGTPVFVHHYKTGANFTFDRAQSGYLTYERKRLKFHPTELRCSSVQPSKRCVVRFVRFGLVPGLVLELLDSQPIDYIKEKRVDFKQQRHVPGNLVSPSSQSGKGADLRKPLRIYLERMVHIYYHSRGADKNRKLANLRSMFNSTLRQMVPKDLLSNLERYEAVCQCIHNGARSGLSIQEIFRQKTCDTRTTKQIRSEILNRLGRRSE